jgi:hypothetical protein
MHLKVLISVVLLVGSSGDAPGVSVLVSMAQIITGFNVY